MGCVPSNPVHTERTGRMTRVTMQINLCEPYASSMSASTCTCILNVPLCYQSSLRPPLPSLLLCFLPSFLHCFGCTILLINIYRWAVACPSAQALHLLPSLPHFFNVRQASMSVGPEDGCAEHLKHDGHPQDLRFTESLPKAYPQALF